MDVITGVMLTVCAEEDLRKKRIPILIPVIAFVAGLMIRIVDRTLFSTECGLGVLVGGIFILSSILSRQQFGLGDGIIMTVCGLCLGVKKVIVLALGAMTLFLVVGVVRMFMFKLNGKQEIPFVPFMWIAFVGGVFWLP